MSPPRQIPITRPLMDEREMEAVRQPISSGWVTQGPEVAAFERELATFVGAPHACAVSSCTTALHLSLVVLGVGEGDEVVTASHSFIATANAIRYCGARPVFVDVDPETYNLDPGRIEAAITSRTRAVLCPHQVGMPCDLESILEVAGRHSLAVIEDAACAIGSEIRHRGQWEKIGKPHGDVACFSFHPRKVITTGDGGMITTARSDLDARLRLLRQHGMSLPDTVRHRSREVVFEEYPVLGYNYRLTDIQAAVGRVQVARLEQIVADRRRLARRYASLLESIDGLGIPREPAWARSNWQSYCVRLPDACDQRRVMQALLDRGVATRRGIMCAHREPAYAGLGADHDLTQSERAQDRCILLPLYPQMSDDDQAYVVETLREACRA